MLVCSDDLEFPRSWLIPVIRDHVKNTQLAYFTSYFFPLANNLKQTGLYQSQIHTLVYIAVYLKCRLCQYYCIKLWYMFVYSCPYVDLWCFRWWTGAVRTETDGKSVSDSTDAGTLSILTHWQIILNVTIFAVTAVSHRNENDNFPTLMLFQTCMIFFNFFMLLNTVYTIFSHWTLLRTYEHLDGHWVELIIHLTYFSSVLNISFVFPDLDHATWILH